MVTAVRKQELRHCPENVLNPTARIAVFAVCALGACTPENRPMSDSSRLTDFATRYTAAWCSQRASSVASFYSESGSLTINDGPPAVGRHGVEAAAQGFMSGYPDLVVKFDRL